MKITLVGMGSGTPGSLTMQGLNALREAELIIGARRLLESLPDGCTGNCAPLYKIEEICALLRTTEAAHVAVAYSGDTGFYSGASALCRALDAAGLPLHGLPGTFQRTAAGRRAGPPLAGLEAGQRPRLCLHPGPGVQCRYTDLFPDRRQRDTRHPLRKTNAKQLRERAGNGGGKPGHRCPAPCARHGAGTCPAGVCGFKCAVGGALP